MAKSLVLEDLEAFIVKVTSYFNSWDLAETRKKKSQYLNVAM